VVFDRFDVSKHMGEALNSVRLSEHRQLMRQGDALLAGLRYHWLWREESLKQSGLKTARAWAIKKLLRELWGCRNEAFAEDHFQCWYGWAVRRWMDPMKKVARMLKKHLTGLLAYFRQSDHQCCDGRAQQQDPGNQVSRSWLNEVRELSASYPVPLRAIRKPPTKSREEPIFEGVGLV
jgi:Transposase